MNEVTFLRTNDMGIFASYNVEIIQYSNGTQKVLYHTFNKVVGLAKQKSKSGGVLSEEEKERFRYLNLINTKQKIIDYAYENHSGDPWEYFFTATFDPKKVDSYNYDEVTQMLSNWLDNMKHQNKNMQYIIVPELHESGRIHFHGIFKHVPNWRLTIAVNPHTGKPIFKNGLQIYNLDNYKLGFTTVSRVVDQEAVSVYISKYINKNLINIKYKKRYWVSKSLKLPVTKYYDFDYEELQNYIKKFEVEYEKIDDRENCRFIFYTLKDKK